MDYQNFLHSADYITDRSYVDYIQEEQNYDK